MFWLCTMCTSDLSVNCLELKVFLILMSLQSKDIESLRPGETNLDSLIVKQLSHPWHEPLVKLSCWYLVLYKRGEEIYILAKKLNDFSFISFDEATKLFGPKTNCSHCYCEVISSQHMIKFNLKCAIYGSVYFVLQSLWCS